MTEDEAREWLIRHFDVSRETMIKLEAFAAAVIAENSKQNLISAATIPNIWSRHIMDSAQLLRLGRSDADVPGPWLDLGTGAGFPGMIIAILTDFPVILVESRRKRFEFLVDQAKSLGLTNVKVHCGRLETLETFPVGTISARAFAPLGKLLGLAHRFSTEKTRWLLPKGRSVREELESVASSWQGSFQVESSQTDADAAIIVATGVRPRKRAR
ncbi:16S rRNA (guanine(527)-N(7))-methyltransferase RsmG [Aquisediminimonas profunda]|uniref:16S rRNA (guanine(527)-N(7))-methyltransferase RsmG n=1 Tax=Aquisediminimonas profunda TaxID=1550733 RepID=UPI001C626E3B|nr:16S rRNA (guanine(527)-N(7))-methyltransferase RsmG [Aquisediminimonas profunda]